MFTKFHKLREDRDEQGFTLIELLVVILIIAILAAIAIPVFLSQRQKGYRSQVQSALKNAATAQESYLTGGAAAYTTSEADLTSEGFKKAKDVTALTITVSGSSAYCIEAGHAQLGTERWAVSSADSTPTQTTCAANGVKT